MEGRRFGRRRVNKDRCLLSDGFRSSTEAIVGGAKTVGVGETVVECNESCDMEAVNEGNSISGANATGCRNVRKDVSGSRKFSGGLGVEVKPSNNESA